MAPFAANGGFVPDSDRPRSFVIVQIGGFVFQKSSQLSGVSYLLRVRQKGFEL